MYTRPPPSTVAPPRFENRVLFDAVRLISRDLVKRAGISSPNRAYVGLLSDIWGQSHFDTIQVLAAQRRHARLLAEKTPPPSKQKHKSTPAANANQLNQQVGTKLNDLPDSLKRKDASRDQLVALLKRVKEDSLVANERRLTLDLVDNKHLDIDAIRHLWGVPSAVFEAAGLNEYFAHISNPHALIRFYNDNIARATPDARIFNILYWYECRRTKENPHKDDPCKHPLRSISKGTVAKVIRVLLTKRRSPFFEKNMEIVIETVLYAINPDSFVLRFREPFLREARFFYGLKAYEYSRSYTGALQNLQLGKLNRMIKDIDAVKAFDKDNHHSAQGNKFLSLQAISKYCSERGTLTDRAIATIYNRYVIRPRVAKNGLVDNTNIMGMSEMDFARMFLSLVGAATDTGLKYWFSVLDQDGDGWVGVGDVAHFYAQRKFESERRNDILLTDVQSLWIRLCAMTGVSPGGRGIDFNSMKELGKADREFVMCALLVRRVDDGNLTNVAATVEVQGKPEKVP